MIKIGQDSNQNFNRSLKSTLYNVCETLELCELRVMMKRNLVVITSTLVADQHAAYNNYVCKILLHLKTNCFN